MTVQELHDFLWNGIRSGELHGKLPSISQLKTRYKTGHNTIHLAIDRLKMQGLVYGRQGKGVFVNEKAANVTQQGIVLFYFGLENTFQTPFYIRMLGLIKQELQGSGLQMEFVSTLPEDLNKYSAAVVFGSNMMKKADLMSLKYALSGRVVLINHKMRGFVSISNDNYAGGRLAVEKLYSAGHRHIGVVTRFLDLPQNFFHERFAGAADFAAEHSDLKITEFRIPSGPGLPNRVCAEIAEKIRLHHPEITGLFAFTDLYAFQLLLALKESGRKIAVVGYDNSEFASLLNPALTTIEEDAGRISRAVCDAVTRLISRGKAASIEINPRLIDRESVFPVSEIQS